MPGNPTYANVLTPQEMTLALQHMLIAPAGTPWTPARVDVDAPPAGFTHLGAVADDSPSMTVNKEKYQVSTGIPSVVSYQAMVGLSAQIGAVLHSFDPFFAYLAMGGLPPYMVPDTATNGYGATLSTTGHSRTLVHVNTPSMFAVNDWVVVDTTVGGAVNTGRNLGWVTAVNSVTGGGNIVLQGTGLPFTPTPTVTTTTVVPVNFSRLALGTSIIPSFHLLGVADMLDGGQIVHDFPRAQSGGEFTQALRNGAHIMTQVSFDCLGYTMSTPHANAGLIVVGELLVFSPTTVA